MNITADHPASIPLSEGTRRSTLAWEWIALAGLLLMGAILPAILAVASGAAWLPRNDDWSYRSITAHLYETRTLAFDGASQSFALGQVAVTYPILALLGGDPAAFWVIGTASAVVVVIAGYLLARSYVSIRYAVLAVLVLLVVPGYLAYSGSFMTDVPSLAGQLVCLAVGVRAVIRREMSLGLGLAAIAAGVFAFSVRQFAIAAPVALVLAALWVSPRRGAVLALATVAGVGLVAAGTASISGQVGSTPLLPAGTWRIAALIVSLSFLMLPITLVSLWRRRSIGSRSTLLIGLLLGAIVWLTAALAGGLPGSIGNLFSPWGAPADGYVIAGRPEVLPAEIWLLVQIVGIISVVPLGDAIARTGIDLWRRHGPAIVSRDPASAHILVIAAYAAMALGGLFAYALGFVVVDRYLWPAIVPLGILLLAPGLDAEKAPDPGRRTIVVLTTSAILLSFGVIAALYTLNSYSFDRGRWEAGTALVDMGYDPSEIDAGYEWLGTYAPGPAQVNDRQIRPEDPLSWYANIWPNFERCALVAGKPWEIAGFERQPDESRGYPMFLAFGQVAPLYLYTSTDPECGDGQP